MWDVGFELNLSPQLSRMLSSHLLHTYDLNRDVFFFKLTLETSLIWVGGTKKNMWNVGLKIVGDLTWPDSC
jgi:hypothetical protein